MNKKLLYILTFFLKGWEVSLLLLLPFIQRYYDINLFQIGALGMVMSVCQITAALFAGHLSEKFGRKQVMTTSLLIYTICWICILSKIFVLLILAFCLGGLGLGLFIPMANSMVAHMASKQTRAKEMGDFSAMTDLGRVAFSGITTYLAAIIGFYILAINYAVLAFVAFIVVSSFHRLPGVVNDGSETINKAKIIEILKNKKFRLTVLSGMFDAFASSSLYIFIPFLLLPKGIDVSSIGLLTAVFFLGYFAGRLALGRLAGKYGSEKVLIIAEIIMAGLIIALILSNSLVLSSVVLFFLGVVTRGTSPILRAMVADSLNDKEEFDKGYSFYSFSMNLSSVVSRPTFGFFANSFGINSSFFLAAIVAVLTIIPVSIFKNLYKTSS